MREINEKKTKIEKGKGLKNWKKHVKEGKANEGDVVQVLGNSSLGGDRDSAVM